MKHILPNRCGYAGYKCTGMPPLKDPFSRSKMVADNAYRIGKFEPEFQEDTPDEYKWNWIDNYLNIPRSVALDGPVNILLPMDHIKGNLVDRTWSCFNNNVIWGSPLWDDNNVPTKYYWQTYRCQAGSYMPWNKGWVCRGHIYTYRSCPVPSEICGAWTYATEHMLDAYRLQEVYMKYSNSIVTIALESPMCFTEYPNTSIVPEEQTYGDEYALFPPILSPVEAKDVPPDQLAIQPNYNSMLDGIMMALTRFQQWDKAVELKLNSLSRSLSATNANLFNQAHAIADAKALLDGTVSIIAQSANRSTSTGEFMIYPSTNTPNWNLESTPAFSTPEPAEEPEPEPIVRLNMLRNSVASLSLRSNSSSTPLEVVNTRAVDEDRREMEYIPSYNVTGGTAMINNSPVSVAGLDDVKAPFYAFLNIYVENNSIRAVLETEQAANTVSIGIGGVFENRSTVKNPGYGSTGQDLVIWEIVQECFTPNVTIMALDGVGILYKENNSAMPYRLIQTARCPTPPAPPENNNER